MQAAKDQVYLKSSGSNYLTKNTKLEDVSTGKDKTTIDALHSQEIKDNLDEVNMDAWYYIYQNFVNPPPKKNKT